MRTTVIFIDSLEETKEGFLRGLFATAIIAVVCAVWYGRKYGLRTVWSALGILLAIVLFASAIAVAQPETAGTAAAYGALVGLVVFGSCNALAVAASGSAVLTPLLVDTALGVALGALTAYLTFLVFKDRYPSLRE